jgi:hypothetical protein
MSSSSRSKSKRLKTRSILVTKAKELKNMLSQIQEENIPVIDYFKKKSEQKWKEFESVMLFFMYYSNTEIYKKMKQNLKYILYHDRRKYDRILENFKIKLAEIKELIGLSRAQKAAMKIIAFSKVIAPLMNKGVRIPSRAGRRSRINHEKSVVFGVRLLFDNMINVPLNAYGNKKVKLEKDILKVTGAELVDQQMEYDDYIPELAFPYFMSWAAAADNQSSDNFPNINFDFVGRMFP